MHYFFYVCVRVCVCAGIQILVIYLRTDMQVFYVNYYI